MCRIGCAVSERMALGVHHERTFGADLHGGVTARPDDHEHVALNGKDLETLLCLHRGEGRKHEEHQCNAVRRDHRAPIGTSRAV